MLIPRIMPTTRLICRLQGQDLKPQQTCRVSVLQTSPPSEGSRCRLASPYVSLRQADQSAATPRSGEIAASRSASRGLPGPEHQSTPARLRYRCDAPPLSLQNALVPSVGKSP